MITQEELIKVARLAKLSLEGEDASALLDSMAGIIGVAVSISELDLSRLDCSCDSEPSVLREDTVTEPLSRDLTLQNAPVKRDGYFAAPPVAGQRQ